MPQLSIKSWSVIFLLILVFMQYSCKQKGKTKVSQLLTTSTPLQSGCYQLIINEDTAWMKMDVNGNRVSGDLNYNRKKKDRNKGTFSGTVSKDTMDVLYSFMSEGIVSHRQIRFIHLKDGFAEGYGELFVRGDTAFFKYPYGLQFETNHLYKNIKCP